MNSYEERIEQARNFMQALSDPELLQKTVGMWEQTPKNATYFVGLLSDLLADHDSYTGRLLTAFARDVEKSAKINNVPHPSISVLGALKTVYDLKLTGYNFTVLYNQIFKNDTDLTFKTLMSLHNGSLDVDVVRSAIKDFEWNTPKGDEVRQSLTDRLQRSAPDRNDPPVSVVQKDHKL